MSRVVKGQIDHFCGSDVPLDRPMQIGPQVALAENMEGEAFDVKFVGMPSQGGTAECPHCSNVVSLPEIDPWLLVDGQLIAGSLEAFPCPRCDGVVNVRREGNVAGPGASVALSALRVDLAGPSHPTGRRKTHI